MQALLIACGVFVLGVGLAVAINRMKIGDTGTFITLLLTPLLVYGIASGIVQEFTAPGGWGAKFRDLAQAKVTVTPTALTPLSQAVQQLDTIQKGGLDELQGLGARLPRNKPIALTFQLGQPGYDAGIASKYIEVLVLTDPQMSVLVLDQDRRFLAMTEGTTMLTLLKQPNQGRQIMMAISGNGKDYLLGLPGFHYDHARHAPLSDVITLDFINTGLEPGARAGIELTLVTAKELRAALDRAIAAAEFEEAEVRGKGAVPTLVRAA